MEKLFTRSFGMGVSLYYEMLAFSLGRSDVASPDIEASYAANLSASPCG
jgi:hypothetical protein